MMPNRWVAEAPITRHHIEQRVKLKIQRQTLFAEQYIFCRAIYSHPSWINLTATTNFGAASGKLAHKFISSHIRCQIAAIADLGRLPDPGLCG
jgi:hypothetical protein